SLRRLLGLAAVCFTVCSSAELTPGVRQMMYSQSEAGDPIFNTEAAIVPGALFACTGTWANRWSTATYTVNGTTYAMCWTASCWVYSGFWYLTGGTEYHFARQYGHGSYLSLEIAPEGQPTKTIFDKSHGLAIASFTPETDGWCQIRVELAPNGYNCGPSETPFSTAEAGLLWNAEPGIVDCTDENVSSWKKFINTDEDTFLYASVPGIKVESDTQLLAAENWGLGWDHNLESGQSYTFSMSKYATNSTLSALLKCSGWTLTLMDGTTTSGTGNKATIDYNANYENARLVWNWTEIGTLSPGMKYGTSVADDDMDFTPTNKVVSSTGLAFAGNKQWAGIQYGEQVLSIGTAAYQFWMKLRKGASYNIAGSFNDYYRVRITDPDGESTTLSGSPATYVPTKAGWHLFDIRFSNGDYGGVGCFTEPYLTALRALVWNVDGPTEVTAENITTEWYRFANEDFETPLFWAEIPPEIGSVSGTVLYLR
ncbi:MAG: hypothetical protein ACI4X9_04180, partial [Kiritimatiellia bacterium]